MEKAGIPITWVDAQYQPFDIVLAAIAAKK
jgi:hypothetical protein